MAVNGWLAADSDMHVMEPADLWQRYMDPRWGHAIPVGLEEIERDMRVKVKNEVLLRLGRMRPQAAGAPGRPAQDSSFVHAEAQRWDAASQVMAMEMEHLDSAVLFPSRGLFVLAMQSTRAHRSQRPRAGARHRHRPRLQRLDGRLRGRLQAPGPRVRRRHAGPARRGGSRRRAGPQCGARVRRRRSSPRAWSTTAVARPEVRPVVARGGAPRASRSASTAAASRPSSRTSPSASISTSSCCGIRSTSRWASCSSSPASPRAGFSNASRHCGSGFSKATARGPPS